MFNTASLKHGPVGNPGLLDFYIPFLSAIHQDAKTSGFGILALSYTGHTPKIKEQHSRDVLGLNSQLINVIDILDAIWGAFGKSVPIVLAGHSVGGWIALQVCSSRNRPVHRPLILFIKAFHARINAVAAVFFLFPTISHIARTPNGRVLAVGSLMRSSWK